MTLPGRLCNFADSPGDIAASGTGPGGRIAAPPSAMAAARCRTEDKHDHNRTQSGVITAYVEAMNTGDFDRLLALFTPDARIHGVTGAGRLDFALPIWKQLHEGLNMRFDVQEMIAEDDRIAVRCREHGRWTGPFLGYTEPTGQTYDLVATEWFEIEDDRIAGRWRARDAAAQARQLGFPSPAAPADKAVVVA